MISGKSLFERIGSFLGYIEPSSPTPAVGSPVPRFIECGGDIALLSPYQLNKVQMYSFLFEGDQALVQGALDHRLNFSPRSPYRYEAFGSSVVVTFMRIEYEFTATQGKRGNNIEHEVMLWAPAIEKIRDGDRWKPNRVIWFTPYVVVDNIWAIVGGRELYGYPKNLGSLQIPHDPGAANAFDATAWGIRSYAASNLVEELPFVKVERRSPRELTGAVDSVRQISRALRKTVLSEGNRLPELSLRLLKNEIEGLFQLGFKSIFLKQFREIGDNAEACYQALIESTMTVDVRSIKGGLLPHDYELSAPQLDTSPAAKELGLRHGDLSKQAFWLDFKAEVKGGKVLFRA